MCLRFPFIGEKMREVEVYLDVRGAVVETLNCGIFSGRLMNVDGGARGYVQAKITRDLNRNAGGLSEKGSV